MYNLSATNKLQDGGTGNSETSRIFVFFITSHLRLIDSCITQLQAQGPSRTGNESKEEEEVAPGWHGCGHDAGPELARQPARPAIQNWGFSVQGSGCWFQG